MAKTTTPEPFTLAGRDEGGGATFWPDTFFVDMSSYEEALRDDAKTPPNGELDEKSWIAGAAHVHEGVHWGQLAGTTFGRLLAFLKASGGDLAQAVITSASRSELERLSNDRRGGTAPAARSKSGRLLGDRGLSFETALLIEHWWLVQAVERLLLDGGSGLPSPRDPAFAVGLALRYVRAGARVGDVFSAPDVELSAEINRHAPQGELPSFRLGLTTRHVEEAAALSSQHLYEARAAQSNADTWGPVFARRRRRRIKSIFADSRNDTYATAIRTFYASSRRITSLKGERALELFLLACDIALNPDVDLAEPRELPWYDFLPAARMERLLGTLRGFIPDEAEIDGLPPVSWWASERARLIDLAGLSDGSRRVSMPPPLAQANSKTLPNEWIRRFLGEAADNMLGFRRSAPSALVSPVYAAEPLAQVRIAKLERRQVGPGLRPPLEFGSDGEGRTEMDHGRYDAILEAVTNRRALWCWLVSAGDVDWRGLPSNRLARDFRRWAERKLPD